MTDPVLKSIRLRGFLSFGPDADAVELGPLNVLIGPNGSGKSNFVEALDVLRSAPGDLPVPIREGGGVRDWAWNGRGDDAPVRCELDVWFREGEVATAKKKANPAVRYHLAFGAEGDRFTVLDERVENERVDGSNAKPYFYFGYEHGIPMFNVAGKERHLQRESLNPAQSILSQRRDPETYPEVSRVGELLGGIQLYRSWVFGPNAAVRRSCTLGLRQDRLNEELDNLPIRLMAMQRSPQVKQRLLHLVRQISDGFNDLVIAPEGGRLQIYLTDGARNVPSHRLSDGTLRMLCLGAILLDPPPKSILVVEEPELGLHPDLMPLVRDMLIEASERAQVLVTTHSTVLADAFTDHAACVLVCEKHDGRTTLTRLAQARIDQWKAHGGLGALWMSGELGGTRW